MNPPPRLWLGAGAVFVVSKGVGPFESRVDKSRNTYKLWELQEAPRGMVVKPRNEASAGVAAYNVIVNKPLDQLVDLAQFFELDEPGIFTVVWGYRPDHIREIVFEIVP